MANDITADKDYKYDPDHKNKPVGGNWEETESGWTTKKQNKSPEKKRFTTPLQGMMNTLDVLGKHVKQNQNGKFIVEDKDWERISSILKKSNGDAKKAYHYSMNMAQAITDPAKAVRRGIATYDSLKGSFGSAVAIETANVFLKRAIELQSKAVAPVKQTPESPKSPSFLRSFIIKSKKISDSGLLEFSPYDSKQAILEPKDKERIRTIISKSGGDNAKIEMFVKNMANAITDPAKAARRGVAILQELRNTGKNVASRRMADIFFTKALYLIGDVGEKEVDPKPISDSNPPKNISAPAAPVKETPVEEPVKESPAKPVSKQPKFRKMKPKLQASMHYLIKDNKLNKDEVEELAGFKNSIMDHPMMSDKEFKNRVEKGLRLPRNQQQLKNAFVQHMDARNYGSPESFSKAKERIQKMSVGDFGKLLGAIMGEEEA